MNLAGFFAMLAGIMFVQVEVLPDVLASATSFSIDSTYPPVAALAPGGWATDLIHAAPGQDAVQVLTLLGAGAAFLSSFMLLGTANSIVSRAGGASIWGPETSTEVVEERREQEEQCDSSLSQSTHARSRLNPAHLTSYSPQFLPSHRPSP